MTAAEEYKSTFTLPLTTRLRYAREDASKRDRYASLLIRVSFESIFFDYYLPFDSLSLDLCNEVHNEERREN